MIKETITYVDFDGNERTEEMHFNMTRSELISFLYDMPEDISSTIGTDENIDLEEAGERFLKKMGESGVFEFMKTLIFKSYGIKSEDGRRFVKSEQLSTEFTQTLAYDEFLISLFETEDKASAFINGIVPASIAGKMAEYKKKSDKSEHSFA